MYTFLLFIVFLYLGIATIEYNPILVSKNFVFQNNSQGTNQTQGNGECENCGGDISLPPLPPQIRSLSETSALYTIALDLGNDPPPPNGITFSMDAGYLRMATGRSKPIEIIVVNGILGSTYLITSSVGTDIVVTFGDDVPIGEKTMQASIDLPAYSTRVNFRYAPFRYAPIPNKINKYTISISSSTP